MRAQTGAWISVERAACWSKAAANKDVWEARESMRANSVRQEIQIGEEVRQLLRVREWRWRRK